MLSGNRIRTSPGATQYARQMQGPHPSTRQNVGGERDIPECGYRTGGIMTVIRGVAATLIAAGVSVGLAWPAWADDFSGRYTLNLIGAGAHTSWTARTTCPPSRQCVAHITSSSGWSGDARLAGGRWTMTVDRPDGHSCPDGTRGAELQTWSWDSTTLVGQVSGVSAQSATCPVGPANDFTLSKTVPGTVTPV